MEAAITAPVAGTVQRLASARSSRSKAATWCWSSTRLTRGRLLRLEGPSLTATGCLALSCPQFRPRRAGGDVVAARVWAWHQRSSADSSHRPGPARTPSCAPPVLAVGAARPSLAPDQPRVLRPARPPAPTTPTQRILDVAPLIPATGALAGWAAAYVPRSGSPGRDRPLHHADAPGPDPPRPRPRPGQRGAGPLRPGISAGRASPEHPPDCR